MARNGSGTYSNPYPNFVSGTVISSTEVDTNNSQIATALTQSIAVDGQSVVTGDIPLATHKFTAMKVGAASTDSLSLGQAQAEAFVWCGTAGGGADAITLSPSPAITAYAAGQRFVWMASGSTNTTATTVAISGLGAIALQDNGAALTAGQHAAGKMFMGILNTTSTVQIMQVQVSGTDPLIVSSLDVTGVATAATFEPDGDTAAADNAAIGYTSAEGLILTGQGSTDDITIKNDADTTVLNVGTGATDVEVSAGNLLFGTGSKGVYLGVTSATAANLLDDYEFGNWTATIVGSTGNPSSDQTATGTYTKTGLDVHAEVYIANKDTSGASGSLKFSGLPFAASTVAVGSIALYNIGAANSVGAWARIAGSATIVEPRTNVNGSPWLATTISAGSGRYAVIDVHYRTA
tara:strand:- start:503 stop:1723 length:1221 start_codon:yes stop_codon:yes gene_type:complete